MNAMEITDWDTFEREIKELRAKYNKPTSPLLFRGQGNSDWPLTTTLERSGVSNMQFAAYYRLICARIGPEVKTFAGVEVPMYLPKTAKEFGDTELFLNSSEFLGRTLYPYMAYLRHFGFPSPLLDWSQSPYVAAFFAFQEPFGKVDKRSIYAYCETPEGIKGGALGEPSFQSIGSYVQTHQRHFRQRCNYTICSSYETNSRQWCFDSHQNVFDKGRRPGQDYLWKFDLPSSERNHVLGVLNDYNLNAFSLFGSEESLLQTMWFREHSLREPSRPVVRKKAQAPGIGKKR